MFFQNSEFGGGGGGGGGGGRGEEGKIWSKSKIKIPDTILYSAEIQQYLLIRGRRHDSDICLRHNSSFNCF